MTYACNLKCKMCGQWNSRLREKRSLVKNVLSQDIWKNVVEEISRHKGTILLLRGGETFLHLSIIDLLRFIKQKGIFVSIDTNGTLLGRFAKDIVRLAIDNIVVSVDGPERIHDLVRGKNAFKMIEAGLGALRKAEESFHISIPKVLCFVISPDSYRSLDKIPDVARQLKIQQIAVIPYYYFNQDIGSLYEKIMRKEFNCSARSWRGFHRELSGINIKEFIKSLRAFKKNLKELTHVPFMNLSEAGYKRWFTNCYQEAKKHTCRNPWLLADIQPNGDVNFCVDFPDYVIGNVRNSSLEEIWNSKKANKFREYLEKKPLPICFRCGAQYMSG
ncbi:MAG: radical SAM protein [Candidatus Omnitrophota bacterium]